MSNVFRSALLILVLGVVQGVSAKETPAGADCTALLSNRASPVDFELSDLEGSFLGLVQMAQTGSAPERSEYFVRDLLNSKADVLNQVTDVLPKVAMGMPEGAARTRALGTLYRMVETLGIAPATWGLKLDNQTNLVSIAVPARNTSKIKPVKEPEVPNNPIGFVTPVNAGQTDVPEGFHRTIGFGAHRLVAHDQPLRKTGQITYAVHPKHKTILMVSDNETKEIYAVDMRIMTAPGALTENNRLSLDFNPDVGEWIINVENLANPTGKIGFLN